MHALLLRFTWPALKLPMPSSAAGRCSAAPVQCCCLGACDTTPPMSVQFVTCLSKNMMVYWRNTEYNAVRLFSTCFLAFLFGSIYWGLGSTR